MLFPLPPKLIADLYAFEKRLTTEFCKSKPDSPSALLSVDNKMEFVKPK